MIRVIMGNQMRNVILGAAFVTIGIATAAPVNARIDVPSDAGANYTMLDRTIRGATRIVITQRDGRSGTSYAKREIDCNRGTFRYLAEGDTLQELIRSNTKPGAMAQLTTGSISYWVVQAACK